MNRTKRKSPNSRNERGVAVVEFALIMPILLMLVFGAIQFGLLFNRQQALHAAAREGARVGSLPSSSLVDISDRATSALDGVALGGTPTVTITPNIANPCNETRRGLTVIVEVSVPTTIEIPIWGTESKTLRGHGEFRCE